MITSDLIAYYCNLLAVQYRTLPNATGTIQALATETVADQIYAQVLNGFNLFAANGYGTAIGAQLDILADYVGAPRRIFALSPSIVNFALTDYAVLPVGAIGFADYADVAAPVDYWADYATVASTYTLTDGQMLKLILYLIAVHASDHTLYSIDIILQTFFGTYCTVADGLNMTLVYTHSTTNDPSVFFAIVKQLNLLPHPAGVAITVVEV